MLNELLKVVKLYIISRARIIISGDNVKPEWGDVILDKYLDIRRCNMSPYTNKYVTRTPVWITHPSSGHFIYMDFWADLYALYKTQPRPFDHEYLFYHNPYIKEIVANLKYMFVTNGVLGSLLWVSYFYIGEMDFYIYFNDDYRIDLGKDITIQILIPKTPINSIKNQ
jgi:hypothetical protein